MLTIEHIQAVVADFFKDKPVKKVWLFGSYAKGEANEESDVDLLVDIDSTKRVGWAFYGWPDELKKRLGVDNVDVLSEAEQENRISYWDLLQKVRKDRLLVYEKG